jgi:drug/metabolite transporter (DMT)-like permease
MAALPVGELCAVSAAICWALGSMAFGRIGRDGVSPAVLNLGKLVSAGGALALTAWIKTGRVVPSNAPPAALALLMVSGVVGLTIGDTAYFGSMIALGVPRAILLLSAAPAFAALGGWLWLGERIDLRSVVGMALVFAGIALVVLRPDPERKDGVGRGLLLGAIAALAQAAGSLMSRRAMQAGIDPLPAAAGRILVGLVGLYAIGLVSRQAVAWTRALFQGRTFVRIGGAAMVGTYCGIWLAQTALLLSRSTGVAATLLATSPIFALPIAHLLGQERMTVRSTLGVVTAVGGIALLSLRG